MLPGGFKIAHQPPPVQKIYNLVIVDSGDLDDD